MNNLFSANRKSSCFNVKRCIGIVYLNFQLFMFAHCQKEQAPLVHVSSNKPIIDNGVLTLKFDLTRGAAISYISLSGEERNIVNICYEGRFIQQSYYADKSVKRQEQGQSPDWSPWSWIPIQVGDAFDNRAEILDFKKSDDEMYVKCIPMKWNMNNHADEAEMEQWTTLERNVLKVRNKLTCHRADEIYGEGNLNVQELLAVYPISALNNLYSYFGDDPFPGAPMVNSTVEHFEDGFWGQYCKNMVIENWMAFVNKNKWGMAVYSPNYTNFLAGMAGQPGGEHADSSTSYIAPVKKEILTKNCVYEYECFIW